MKSFEEKYLQYLTQTKTVVIETWLSSQASSHSTPIWVIVEDQHVYVRSYRGQAGRWYQEITGYPFAILHLNGELLAVQAVRVTDEATIARVSQALVQKYPASSYADPMIREEILETTLRLEPASSWPAAFATKREGRRNHFSLEERAFLLNGTKTGKLATVRADGRPHIVPVAFDLDGDAIVILVMQASVKARNMQRDPRVCLCVDVETAPYAYIQVEGTVEMSADLSVLAYWGERIVTRYDGPEQGEAYIKREALARERVVRLTPTNILFRKNIGGKK